MFGWLRRSKPATKAPLPAPDPEPLLDSLGRQMRPRLRGFSVPSEASKDQRLQALQWAKEWTGNALLPMSAEQLLEPLANALSGKTMRADGPDISVVQHAARALSLSAQEARAERTKGAFPEAELRLGPQKHPCYAAIQRAGQPFKWDDMPRIPLPECDQTECKCWFRQVTKAEFQRVHQRGARMK